MPNLKHAKKKQRQDVKRTTRNKITKIKMKASMKDFMKSLQKDVNESEQMLKKAYSAIDTALKKKLIQKNNAARKKSNLAKALKKIQGGMETAVKNVKKHAKETENKAESQE